MFLNKILNYKHIPFAKTVKEVAVYPTLFLGLSHSIASEEIWKHEQREINTSLNLGKKNPNFKFYFIATGTKILNGLVI